MPHSSTRPLAMRAIPIAALAIATLSATPALAWSNCGTPLAESDCADHGLPGAPTPSPVASPPAAVTPVTSPAPVAQPTSAAASSLAPNTTSSAGSSSSSSSASSGGAISRLPIYCHYEPSTGNWEIRHESQPQAGDQRPNSAGLCVMSTPVTVARHQPTVTPAVPQPTAAPAPPVVASAPMVEISNPVVAQPTPMPVAQPPARPTPVVLSETATAPPPVPQAQPAQTLPENLAAPNTGDAGLVTDLDP